MQKLFNIYLSFLQVGQSETLLRHVFAGLRAFLNNYSIALFQGARKNVLSSYDEYLVCNIYTYNHSLINTFRKCGSLRAIML